LGECQFGFSVFPKRAPFPASPAHEQYNAVLKAVCPLALHGQRQKQRKKVKRKENPSNGKWRIAA